MYNLWKTTVSLNIRCFTQIYNLSVQRADFLMHCITLNVMYVCHITANTIGSWSWTTCKYPSTLYILEHGLCIFSYNVETSIHIIYLFFFLFYRWLFHARNCMYLSIYLFIYPSVYLSSFAQMLYNFIKMTWIKNI